MMVGPVGTVLEMAGGRCDGRVHTMECTLAGTPAVPLHCTRPWSLGPDHQSSFPPPSNQPGTGQEATSWSPKICPKVPLQAIDGGRIHSIYLSSRAMPGPLQHSSVGAANGAIAASFSRDRHRSSRHTANCSIVPSNL
jgi:hypothetical protein